MLAGAVVDPTQPAEPLSLAARGAAQTTDWTPILAEAQADIVPHIGKATHSVIVTAHSAFQTITSELVYQHTSYRVLYSEL